MKFSFHLKGRNLPKRLAIVLAEDEKSALALLDEYLCQAKIVCEQIVGAPHFLNILQGVLQQAHDGKNPVVLIFRGKTYQSNDWQEQIDVLMKFPQLGSWSIGGARG